MAAGHGMNRYARQSILPEIGQTGQQKIASAHVLIVGAGGLGVPALQYLVGAGVGHITLVDPDTVEESNLHRQPIYRMTDIGQFKVAAAAQAMAGLNPGVAITALPERLTPTNASALIASAQIVLDCADSYAASYTLSDTCLEAGKPLISASALGMAGYVGGFCGGAPSLRALFPEPPDSGQTCASAGVLVPVVGMLGCLQAQMALAILTDLTPSPLGQFIRFEAGRFTQFRFDKAPENTGPRFIAITEVRDSDLVIDLRPADEAPHKATPSAQRIPGYGTTGPLPEPDQRVVLACRSGLRAWRAAAELSRRWSGEITLLAIGDD